MQTSESTKEISTALCKAQIAIKHVVKDCENGFYKSKYADLTAVIDEVKPILNACDITIIQGPDIISGVEVLTTRLLHTSGEWIESNTKLVYEGEKGKLLHAQGSAITYSRRYALAAMVCLGQDDDDGCKAVDRKSEPAKQQTDAHKKVITDDYEIKGGKYAGRKIGGLLQKDVVDFYMAIKDMDFKNAVIDYANKKFVTGDGK